MKPRAYYNEVDPFAVNWLKALISMGEIMEGDVDDRPVQEVSPGDLKGYTRVHLFAGIAGWDFGLQIARWPEARPVWTGSCPCQPLSSAGRKQGHADGRHLWPAFFDLIAEHRPPEVFGEQVSGKLGYEWVAGVRADLEDEGYTCGIADLPACSVGAPHRRARLYWVAHAESRGTQVVETVPELEPGNDPDRRRGNGGVEHPESTGGRRRPEEISGNGKGEEPGRSSANDGGRLADSTDKHRGAETGGTDRPETCDSSRVGDSGGERREPGVLPGPGQGPGTGEGERHADEHRGPGVAGGLEHAPRERRPEAVPEHIENHGKSDAMVYRGPWSESRTITMRDGKTRRIPTEPEFYPLAYGIQARVGRLRGYGNAVVPQVAAVFIRSYLEALEDLRQKK